MGEKPKRAMMALSHVGYRGRYAPSPTGDLHMGNAFAALYAHHRAHTEEGICLLRWEDLDVNRIADGAKDRIQQNLLALGLSYGGGSPKQDLVQSEHIHRYEEALRHLKEAGWLYACTCSRKFSHSQR